VSLPCWELFERQDEAYRSSVLPARVKARVAVEAGVAQGWAHYVGAEGVVISQDAFGMSAPYSELMEHFGLTVEAVVAAARRLVEKAAG
jgi:transketolase